MSELGAWSARDGIVVRRLSPSHAARPSSASGAADEPGSRCRPRSSIHTGATLPRRTCKVVKRVCRAFRDVASFSEKAHRRVCGRTRDCGDAWGAWRRRPTAASSAVAHNTHRCGAARVAGSASIQAHTNGQRLGSARCCRLRSEFVSRSIDRHREAVDARRRRSAPSRCAESRQSADLRGACRRFEHDRPVEQAAQRAGGAGLLKRFFTRRCGSRSTESFDGEDEEHVRGRTVGPKDEP